MLVKYVGHIPSFIHEFNRERYMFTSDGKPVDIPVKALIDLYASNTPNSVDIIPVENEDIERLIKENDELKKKIERLEINAKPESAGNGIQNFMKRGRGRPRRYD